MRTYTAAQVAANKRWYESHKEERKALSREYYRTHTEERKAYSRQWALDHPLERRKINLRSTRRKWFGLEDSDVDQFLTEQEHKCSICGVEVSIYDHLDHDHETGKVRGILCHGCNCGLGLFKESPGSLRKAADYLERHKAIK